MKERHVLSVLVSNRAGVLTRVAGLFARRMYNIDSLTVGVTEDPEVSKMTIVAHEDADTIEQVKNQLLKLVDVLDIKVLTKDNAVLREHVLIKVSSKDSTSVMQLCDIFRASIVDVSREIMTAELTGAPSKINAFLSLMEQYDVHELVRTGLTGLLRG